MHNPLATAEAMQAVDAIRQQQRALAKKVVYAPFEASVAIKVCFWQNISREGRLDRCCMYNCAWRILDLNLTWVRCPIMQLLWLTPIRLILRVPVSHRCESWRSR